MSYTPVTAYKLGRARNEGVWRAWPLRRIVSRERHNAAVIETLECGHAQYTKARIVTEPDKVRFRRCRSCGDKALDIGRGTDLRPTR